MIYIEIFIAFEFIAYIIIFWHLHKYNKDLKKEGQKNRLGLSNEVIAKRKRCNVISFGGQFASFIIEIVGAITFHVLLEFHSSNAKNGYIPVVLITCGAILTIAFFIASPELRRFYFTK